MSALRPEAFVRPNGNMQAAQLIGSASNQCVPLAPDQIDSAFDDIMQPLSALMVRASIVRESVDPLTPGDLAEQLAAMRSSARRLARQIDNALCLVQPVGTAMAAPDSTR